MIGSMDKKDNESCEPTLAIDDDEPPYCPSTPDNLEIVIPSNYFTDTLSPPRHYQCDEDINNFDFSPSISPNHITQYGPNMPLVSPSEEIDKFFDAMLKMEQCVDKLDIGDDVKKELNETLNTYSKKRYREMSGGGGCKEPHDHKKTRVV